MTDGPRRGWYERECRVIAELRADAARAILSSREGSAGRKEAIRRAEWIDTQQEALIRARQRGCEYVVPAVMRLSATQQQEDLWVESSDRGAAL